VTFARSMKPSDLMRRHGKYWGCRGCNECFESTRAFKRHLCGDRCMTDEETRGRGLATAAAAGSMSRVWTTAV
jgi:hypothetical protein